MDGFEQLTRRHSVRMVGLVVVALLPAGCGSGIQSGSPSPTTAASGGISYTSQAIVLPEPSGRVVVPPLNEVTVAMTMEL